MPSDRDEKVDVRVDSSRVRVFSICVLDPLTFDLRTDQHQTKTIVIELKNMIDIR